MNTKIKDTLTRLEKDLPKELKEDIIDNFNEVTDSNITKLTDDERIFVSIYLVLVGNLAQAGGSLNQVSIEGVEDVPKEDERDFMMSAGYASEVMKVVMESAATSQIIAAIHA